MRVQVTDAPGYEDYEGVVTHEFATQDGYRFFLVESEWEGVPVQELHREKYVKEIE